MITPPPKVNFYIVWQGYCLKTPEMISLKSPKKSLLYLSQKDGVSSLYTKLTLFGRSYNVAWYPLGFLVQITAMHFGKVKHKALQSPEEIKTNSTVMR